MRRRNGQAGARRGQTGIPVAPKSDRDKAFCKKYLEHFDKERAFREAGFIGKDIVTQSSRKLARFADYLRPLQEAKAREVAKVMVLEQDTILRAMARTAVFSPGEFIERGSPIIDERKVGKRKKLVPRMWEGKQVYSERMKPFVDLTLEQQLTVEVTGLVGEQIQYRLPSIKERHAAQVALGRQFGMFLDKLIVERHNSRGGHAQLQLDDVPTAELQSITQRLLPYVGQEFASRLGFTLEDIEEAKKHIIAEVPARPR